jgi:hypothetical protein
MVSSLADIPSAGAAKMVGGKLELPAQTADTCTVIYIHGSSANLYLNAEGLNEPVVATSGHGDCWSTPADGVEGEIIYSGSGRCLAEDAELNRAVMQNCTGAEWQEWWPQSGGDSATVYYNDWASDEYGAHTMTAGILATNSLVSGTYVYATGNFPDQWTLWYK